MVSEAADFSPADGVADVLVLGGGPSGLALAASLAARGLATVVLAPDISARWARSYGAFSDELVGLGLSAAVLRHYDSPTVRWDDGAGLTLQVPYTRLHTGRLKELLMERAGRAGVRFLAGLAEHVSLDGPSGLSLCRARVAPGPGEAMGDDRDVQLRARLVVNATGARSDVGLGEVRRPSGYQTAYGQWIEVSEHGFSDGQMSLMDFRPLEVGGLATFLYALPESGPGEGPGTLFVQETSLVARQPLPLAELRQRLGLRLTQLGLEPLRVLGTERCIIPLGGALPKPSGFVLPFGAAAGLTHPATGYQLATALRAVEPLSESIAHNLSQGAERCVSEAVHQLWPDERRRAYHVFELGADVLLGLPAREMRVFIREFFSLPDPVWRQFMAGTMEAGEVMETMWRVFQRSPVRLRTQLLGRGTWASVRTLATQLHTLSRSA